jgi:hypothetical protein
MPTGHTKKTAKGLFPSAVLLITITYFSHIHPDNN